MIRDRAGYPLVIYSYDYVIIILISTLVNGLVG